MENPVREFFRFLMQLMLYRKVRRRRRQLASACRIGYTQRGKGCLMIDEREGTRCYRSARDLRATEFERLARRGLPTERLQALLGCYDPTAAGVVVVLNDQCDARRRSLVASLPELAEVFLGEDVPETAVMQRFDFAAPPEEDPNVFYTDGEWAALECGLAELKAA